MKLRWLAADRRNLSLSLLVAVYFMSDAVQLRTKALSCEGYGAVPMVSRMLSSGTNEGSTGAIGYKEMSP
eukprot:CAMPEP_0114497876 /NCGR_PEP_ID=MMETSP0109-20121206/6570_1 /TAXON_ID=29199 /ORGANISM="Chlorarachnion reptans, Strain CCCM449" /LENGTH=69 /DNA_ID=CAMNT_0001675311 /DNA_START=98 /DNA_END=307 /DNA_ORIENTATION=-